MTNKNESAIIFIPGFLLIKSATTPENNIISNIEITTAETIIKITPDKPTAANILSKENTIVLNYKLWIVG